MYLTAVVLAVLLAQEQGQSVDELVAELKGDDIDVRERAVEKLIARGPEALSSVKPLRRSLDPDLAQHARQIVGHIEWDPYLPPYARTLSSLDFASLGSGTSRNSAVPTENSTGESRRWAWTSISSEISTPRAAQPETNCTAIM